MRRPVAVLSLPSDRLRDQQLFPGQAKQIVHRNEAKARRETGTFSPGDVFSRGANTNVDEAFQRLQPAFTKYRKIYLLAHGNPYGVEKAQIVRSDESDHFTAPELVDKFMDKGGMRAALNDFLNSATHGSRGAEPKFVTSLRLLSCETGREPDDSAAGQFHTTTSKTYIEDFGRCVGREIVSMLKQLKSDHAEKYAKACFFIEITFAAPRGWNVVLKNGQTVAYFCDSKRESRVDASFGAIFENLENKEDAILHPRINKFLLPESEKKQKIVLRVQKYANTVAAFDFN
jgi:hypothetical protein